MHSVREMGVVRYVRMDFPCMMGMFATLLAAFLVWIVSKMTLHIVQHASEGIIWMMVNVCRYSPVLKIVCTARGLIFWLIVFVRNAKLCTVIFVLMSPHVFNAQ